MKKKIMLNRLMFALVFSAVTIQLTAEVPAQATPGLMAWPSKVDLSVKAGGTKTGYINVQNQGLNKVRLKVTIMNCRMTEEGTIIYTNKNVPFGCKQWLRAEPAEFELSPRASQQVLYAIDIPGTAQGTYMAVILFEPSVSSAGDYQNLPGALMIENVPGTGHKKAEFKELTFEKGVGGGHVNAVLGISNEGSLICIPSGKLDITNTASGSRKSFVLNPEKEPVLPFSLRRFRIPLEGIYNGQYKAIAEIDYQGAEILQGEAAITISAGDLISQKGRVLPGSNKTGGRQQPAGDEPVQGKPPRPAKTEVKPTAPALSSGEIDQMNREATKLYSAGNYKEALAIWQKVLRSDPGNPGAQKGAERAKQKMEALRKIKQ